MYAACLYEAMVTWVFFLDNNNYYYTIAPQIIKDNGQIILLSHKINHTGGPPSDANPVLSSILTERAMETIRLLRKELERCHADLQTDEELFAEKVDELSEVQSAYSQLVREKERLEEMWLAAQEKEGNM